MKHLAYLLCPALLLASCSKDPPLPVHIDLGTQDTAEFPSQNLITNPSFEFNGDSTYAGWVISWPWGNPTGWWLFHWPTLYHVPKDTNWRHFEQDAPPQGGNWSIVLPTGKDYFIRPPTYANWYVTGQNGTALYTLTFWTKYMSFAPFSYKVRLAKLQNGELFDEAFVEIYDTTGWQDNTNGWSSVYFTTPDTVIYSHPYHIKAWKQYTLQSTFNLQPDDTLLVRLGSHSDYCLAGSCYLPACLYDLVTLTKQPLD